MSHPRWLRKCTAWIALLAVCFGASAPTLSQAALKANGNGGRWVQICSASGLTWVRADAGQAADAADGHPAEAAPACPWGVMAGGAASPPPTHALRLPEPGPWPGPVAQAQRDRDAPANARARARAPPRAL